MHVPIFTFVTDRNNYAEMRRSFRAAGFGADLVCFNELHACGNPLAPEPYSTITELIRIRKEPFFILCHQDIRIDQGHGWQQFTAAMETLYSIDPMWGVAGNAGGSNELHVVRRITDSHGDSTADAWPAEVQSLDENFLVIRSGTQLRCSAELYGFHFYATDLCLSARTSGRGCYVIDFHVHHLSGGREMRSTSHAASGWSRSGVPASLRVIFALRQMSFSLADREFSWRHSVRGRLGRS